MLYVYTYIHIEITIGQGFYGISHFFKIIYLFLKHSVPPSRYRIRIIHQGCKYCKSAIYGKVLDLLSIRIFYWCFKVIFKFLEHIFYFIKLFFFKYLRLKNILDFKIQVPIKMILCIKYCGYYYKQASIVCKHPLGKLSIVTNLLLIYFDKL